MKIMEGSEAIASAVELARPSVIAAYPITPQTHIAERLADAVAAGRLRAEYITVESEHSAASVVLGASATGVRTFTATSSQGLLYMSEVVYGIAGMRLPVVMTVANRALSSPLSIWNDHQDSMALRDAGWIQLFAQNAQEAHDLHLIAYRLAEDERVLLPVMICVDGFVLTHAFEPVHPLTSEQAGLLIPPAPPRATLDPSAPLTLGAFAEPAYYTEARHAIAEAMGAAGTVLAEALRDLKSITGRTYHPLFDTYKLEDAETALIAMGTVAQTARLAVDELRAEGERAGLLALRTFRPFPATEVRAALEHTGRIAVVDRAVSLGNGGVLTTEVRAALYPSAHPPVIVGVVAGLGGRNVSVDTLRAALEAAHDTWADLRPDEDLLQQNSVTT